MWRKWSCAVTCSWKRFGGWRSAWRRRRRRRSLVDVERQRQNVLENYVSRNQRGEASGIALSGRLDVDGGERSGEGRSTRRSCRIGSSLASSIHSCSLEGSFRDDEKRLKQRQLTCVALKGECLRRGVHHRSGFLKHRVSCAEWMGPKMS